MTDVEMDDMEADALGQAFLESRAEEFGLFAAAWKAGREYGEDNLALVVSGCGQAENRVFELEDKLAKVEAHEKANDKDSEYWHTNYKESQNALENAEDRVFELEDKLATGTRPLPDGVNAVHYPKRDGRNLTGDYVTYVPEERLAAVEANLVSVEGVLAACEGELTASTHLEMHTEDRRLGAEDRAELAERQWGRAGRLLIQILAWLDDDTGASLDGEIVERVRGLVRETR